MRPWNHRFQLFVRSNLEPKFQQTRRIHRSRTTTEPLVVGMSPNSLLIDIHTHVYLPRYASMLRERTSTPRIIPIVNQDGLLEERLCILDHEPSAGRPIGPQYWDRDEKLSFMDRHGIDISVVSSANPWLDFLPPSTAQKLAFELNNDLEQYCSSSPTLSGTSLKRLYGFGLLPLVPDIPIPTLLQSISHLSSLPHLKGIIIGTRGLGKGLDDDTLDPLWAAIEQSNLLVFLHPHYGLGTDTWGEKPNGHVLPLALGFPFETTTATARLILSGVLDRFPSLRLLLAHAGGVLPQLSSRLASCVDHDPVVASRLQHDVRYYLGKLYYDAVAYGSEELGLVSDVVARSHMFEGRVSSSEKQVVPVDRIVGSGRMLFGTDHPFFPPLSPTEKWRSVLDNLEAIHNVNGWDADAIERVRGRNALELLQLSS